MNGCSCACSGSTFRVSSAGCTRKLNIANKGNYDNQAAGGSDAMVVQIFQAGIFSAAAEVCNETHIVPLQRCSSNCTARRP